MILYKHFKLINSRTNRQLVVLPSLVVSPGVVVLPSVQV